ncbi:hypothetical protein GCM10011581_46230 [Saccharopolyspora subtropica]|uniref:DUF6879 domain-containing protein n=1 Tax=Saccharopolyspora thermophila TaxID=89367 RepID=A0A917KA21_9PSEU|nr:DUF6879 family protein [Saccharopolyspora subtropica]GGJ03963.1 hypothetical protein GCM10011581_46230 [Saccharopolyspora subtropica]
MVDLVSGAEFDRLFRTFRDTAFRLETQGVYREPVEDEPLRRFLNGEPPDDSWLAPWTDNVRAATSEGRKFQRVRVLTEPLTDYLRFEMDLALRANLPAGEEIRSLSMSKAESLGLPIGTDFWMFDDDRVGVMHFGERGMLGLEMITDVTEIERYRQWRDRAWSAAAPAEEWAVLVR